MSSANLLVRIGLDAGELSAGLSDLNARLSEAGRSATTALSGFQKFGTTLSSIGSTLSVAVSGPLAAFGVTAVKTAADLESLKLGLTAITGSAKETEVQFKRLVDVAKLPGLGLTEAVQGSIRLQAVGISAQQSERYLKAFGNALATVGRGRADLDAVLVQLTQMASKSKVLSQDFKPILERVPQIAKITKDLFGTIDTEELQKLGISSRDFIDQIVSVLEKGEKATGGLNNAFGNLADNAKQAFGTIGDSIVRSIPDFQGKVDALGNALVSLAEKFAALPGPAKAAAVGIGGIAVASGPLLFVFGQLAQSIVSLATAFKLIQGLQIGAAFSNAAFALSNGLIPALTLAEKAALGLTLTLRAIPWVGLAAGIYYLGEKMLEVGAKGDTIKPKMDAINEKWREQNGIVTKVRQSYNDLVDSMKNFKPASGPAVDPNKLASAFGDLNIKSTKVLTEELNKQKAALETVQRAAAAGQATDRDLANAKDAVTKATRELTEAQIKLADDAGKKAQKYADASADMLDRYDKQAQAYIAGQRDLQKIDDEATRAREQYNKAIIESDGKRLKANEEYVDKEVKITQTLGQRIGEVVGKAISDINRLNEAFKESGADRIVSQEAVDRAKENFEIIAKSGTASAAQLLRAWVTYYDKFLQLQRSAGREVSKDQQKALDDAKAKIDALDGVTKQSVANAKRLTQQVSTILTDLSRGIAQAIIQGKSIGDVFKKVGVDIAESIIRVAIEKGIKVLINNLDVVLSKLGSIGKKIADVFGSASGGIGGGGSSAGSAAGSAGSGGSGAAGSVASGALGWATFAASAATAVSSIIGNFQSARQEKTLNAIEESTRYTQIRTQNIESYVVKYMPMIEHIHQRLVEISGNTFGAERGVSQLVLNVDGRRLADALIPYIGRTIQVSVG